MEPLTKFWGTESSLLSEAHLEDSNECCIMLHYYIENLAIVSTLGSSQRILAQLDSGTIQSKKH